MSNTTPSYVSKLIDDVKEEIKIIAHSIGFHHEREFSFESEELEREIEELKKEIDNFKYDKITDKLELRKLSKKYQYFF